MGRVWKDYWEAEPLSMQAQHPSRMLLTCAAALRIEAAKATWKDGILLSFPTVGCSFRKVPQDAFVASGELGYKYAIVCIFSPPLLRVLQPVSLYFCMKALLLMGSVSCVFIQLTMLSFWCS